MFLIKAQSHKITVRLKLKFGSETQNTIQFTISSMLTAHILRIIGSFLLF